MVAFKFVVLGALSCAQGWPLPPLLFAEWLNDPPGQMRWLHWASCNIAVGSLKWSGFDWTAAPPTLSSRRAWKIQTCYEYVHAMQLFQHLVNELIPVTTTLLGSSKHSYLFPQDRCWLKYTLQSIICGPWLYHSQRDSWLSAECHTRFITHDM